MDKAIKILCVDDEPNVLSAVKRIFLDDEYIIYTALTGEEGFELLEREEVQIVISDYRMPGIDGIAFLKRVYRRWPDTIRIVLSGYADISIIVAAINEGHIYKFIPKPWNDDELKLTISHAVEKYFLHKRNIELTMTLKTRNDELSRLNEKLELLVKERTENLDFRNKIVVSYQNILNFIPAGIVGLDLNGDIVLSNSAWINITRSGWHIMGKNLEGNLPEEITRFFEEVKAKGFVRKDFTILGTRGIMAGSLMDEGEHQKGVIMVFTPLDGLA